MQTRRLFPSPTAARCAMVLIFALVPLLLASWSAAAPQVSACVPATFRLAIDIGHYRAASGASSATGVAEFDYNLALARATLAQMRHAGFTAAFLIGESGAPLPLEERTHLAAKNHAALFISLHHDSVQPAYLNEWMVDGRIQRYSDQFHGFSIFLSERNPYPAESRFFAETLGEALLSVGLTPSHHHAEPITGEGHQVLDTQRGIFRYDALAVLRTATMPAALLESAVIVNRVEEQRVRSGEYHAKVVAALVKAVTAYCDRYPHGT